MDNMEPDEERAATAASTDGLSSNLATAISASDNCPEEETDFSKDVVVDEYGDTLRIAAEDSPFSPESSSLGSTAVTEILATEDLGPDSSGERKQSTIEDPVFVLGGRRQSVAGDSVVGGIRRTKTEKALAIMSLAIGLTLYALDQTMVANAIPSIVNDLGGEDLLSWVGTANLLCSTAFAPLWGKLGDIVGRKNLLIFNTVVFLLASLVSALAPSMIVLIVGRALQGFGAGGIQGLTFVLISDVVTLQERGQYQAILGAITGGSSILGPFLGGVIVQSWSWRGVFFILIPLGVVAIVGFIFFLKVKPLTEKQSLRVMAKRIDWGGAFLCVVGVGLFLLGLTWSVRAGWTAPQVLVPLILGLGLMVAFVLYEWKVPNEPNVPLRLFLNRNFSLITATLFFMGWSMSGATFYIPIFFQYVQGDTPIQSGTKMIAWMAAHIVFSMSAGLVSSRFGVYIFFPKTGLAVASIGMGLLTLWNVSTSLGMEIGFLVMLGVGFGVSLSMLLLALQANLHTGDIGPGTTTGTFLRTIGGTVGIGLAATIMQTVVISVMSPEYVSQLAVEYGVSVDSMATIVKDALARQPTAPSDTMPQSAIDGGYAAVASAYATALSRVFLSFVPMVCLGWFIVLFVKHVPLRGKARPQSGGTKEKEGTVKEAVEISSK